MGLSILFSHQNYPAQFGAFGAYLARNGWDVTFITEKDATPPPGCRLYRMKPLREPAQGVHRFALPLERAMINGQAFATAAMGARAQGLRPDVVVAHSGWGSGTFAKAIWPDTRYVSYVEWYYRWPSPDLSGEEAGHREEESRAKALARNGPTLLDFAEADLVICPTRFQTAQFPRWLRERVTVIHDGVDTDFHAPDPAARMPLPDGVLPEGSEVVTYATRGMEPHRGFPEFMRALALLQKTRPNLHAVIGGEDRVAYGKKLPEGKTWKARMLEELDLDPARLHWTGLLPRPAWRAMLQATDVHVYLTVPFVLSWSMIEAMAAGAPLVVSRTPPVLEAVEPGVTAEAVDHADTPALAAAIAGLLDDRARARAMGAAARAAAVRNYSSGWLYPARARLFADLATG